MPLEARLHRTLQRAGGRGNHSGELGGAQTFSQEEVVTSLLNASDACHLRTAVAVANSASLAYVCFVKSSHLVQQIGRKSAKESAASAVVEGDVETVNQFHHAERRLHFCLGSFSVSMYN